MGKTELDGDDPLGPVRAAKGATAQSDPCRTFDSSVKQFSAKYDAVRKAGQKLQAALDQVQLATKFDIAIDNWTLKNVKKLAEEPYVKASNAAKKAVDAILSAQSDVTDALALARSRENASKGKEKRASSGATTFANVYDAAAATDAMKDRAAARRHAIKRFFYKQRSSDEELGKASPYLLSTSPRYKQLSDKIKGLTKNSVSASDLASMSARIDDLGKAMEARSTAHNDLRTLAAKSTDVEQLRGCLFQLIDSDNQHRTQYKATVESLRPLLAATAGSSAAGAQPQEDHGQPQARVEPTGGRQGRGSQSGHGSREQPQCRSKGLRGRLRQQY